MNIVEEEYKNHVQKFEQIYCEDGRSAARRFLMDELDEAAVLNLMLRAGGFSSDTRLADTSRKEKLCEAAIREVSFKRKYQLQRAKLMVHHSSRSVDLNDFSLLSESAIHASD